MIFRKPYAFLIKNFRKIHILMLILCFFIYIKLNIILSFIKDYISFGTYSASLESFSSKTGFFFYLALILIIAISLMLIVLLKRKQKPWKIYLIYIGEYLLILFGIIFVANYFASYGVETSVSGVMIYRDMLNICKYLQYVILVFLIIRVLGLDLKKFNFNSDAEFLELSSEDREEFEVSFEFDKNSFKRGFNRFKRNFNYFYQEHKFICNVVVTFFTIFIVGYSYYYFGIIHKSYKQGQTFNSGIYSITVQDSYVTDKDMSGNKIEKNNKFVILVVKVKNNYKEAVEPNLNRYHLVNRNTDKTYNVYYNSYFTDIGKSADAKENIASNQEKTFYMVYKVDNSLDNRRFVLYYQELGGKLGSYLRKIKLNLTDVSTIKNVGDYKISDNITFDYINGKKKMITVTASEVNKSFNYNRYYCASDDSCSSNNEIINAKDGNSLLKITFASSDFEGEDFIDFSSQYGKIKYIDSKGKVVYADIKNAISMNYQGKEIFITAKSEVLNSSQIWIEYTLRNKRYTLKIK